MGWNDGNLISTIGACILGVGIAIYFSVMIYTYFKGERVGRDVWDARTLEWSLPNPPPEYNFAVIPTIHARDAWWYEKHHRDEMEKETAAHARDEAAHGGIHMPFPSIYPLLTAIGILIWAIGVAVIDPNPAPGIHLKLGMVFAGFAFMFVNIYLWALEGADGYHLHPHEEHAEPSRQEGHR